LYHYVAAQTKTCLKVYTTAKYKEIMVAILLFVVRSSNVSYMFYNNMSNIRTKKKREDL